MITKELLSEVLGFECVPHKENNSDVWFEYEEEKDYGLLWTNESINIYELAHKCKEWAWNYHSVRVESGRMYGYQNKEVWNAVICVYNGHKFYKEDEDFWIEAATEPEAIFKACEWILENK